MTVLQMYVVQKWNFQSNCNMNAIHIGHLIIHHLVPKLILVVTMNSTIIQFYMERNWTS